MKILLGPGKREEPEQYQLVDTVFQCVCVYMHMRVSKISSGASVKLKGLGKGIHAIMIVLEGPMIPKNSLTCQLDPVDVGC